MIGIPAAESECTQPVLLGSPVFFETGPNPHYMASEDFNGDGIADLAVTNGDISPGSNNSSLAVLLGLGSRSYASPVLYLVGRGARSVVARDFNKDGITDLAVSNLHSDEISVLLGQGTVGIGNGTFAPSVNYPAGPGPFELVADDFNGDGILDLATCLNRTAAVLVFPGLGSGGIGNGSFGGAVSFPLSHLSTGLARGDFNGDGHPDLVATQNYGSSIAVLLGTGQVSLGPGSFGPAAYHAAGAEPYHVEVADFDEDGRQDLAVANGSTGGIKVLLGLGDGSFLLSASLASGNSSGAAAVDLNQDGILDIVTGTITGYNVGVAEVFLGQGTGGVGSG
ncbi:MAG: FG-GAP repeat domain-containing protein, partial [bacterium]